MKHAHTDYKGTQAFQSESCSQALMCRKQTTHRTILVMHSPTIVTTTDQ